jgi:uncharacterized protein YqhQ
MSATKPFYYGGQAVIEGVMMRGRRHVAIAVRCPNGEINVTGQPLATMYKGRFREMPFTRGVVVLIETLVLGIQALLHSANVVSTEETGEKISPYMLWGTMAIGILFAVAIFFVTPLLIATYLIYPYIDSALVGNLIEGVIRIGMFILYLWVVGRLRDIKTVFAYHGAEHKAVNAYESGQPLELEYVRKYSTAHARCGTSFLLIVLVLAIIVFALIGRPPLWLGIISRIVLIPVIAAIGYEVVRFGAGHVKNPIMRRILAPGLALQSMTTREPSDSQLETAISALKKVIEADAGESQPQSDSLSTPHPVSLSPSPEEREGDF